MTTLSTPRALRAAFGAALALALSGAALASPQISVSGHSGQTETRSAILRVHAGEPQAVLADRILIVSRKVCGVWGESATRPSRDYLRCVDTARRDATSQLPALAQAGGAVRVRSH